MHRSSHIWPPGGSAWTILELAGHLDVTLRNQRGNSTPWPPNSCRWNHSKNSKNKLQTVVSLWKQMAGFPLHVPRPKSVSQSPMTSLRYCRYQAGGGAWDKKCGCLCNFFFFFTFFFVFPSHGFPLHDTGSPDQKSCWLALVPPVALFWPFISFWSFFCVFRKNGLIYGPQLAANYTRKFKFKLGELNWLDESIFRKCDGAVWNIFEFNLIFIFYILLLLFFYYFIFYFIFYILF